MDEKQNSRRRIGRRWEKARRPVSWYVRRPLFWPRWLRRAVLILLPVSLPIILVLWVLMPFWIVLAYCAQMLCAGLRKIWNARQRTVRHAPYSIY